jgi:hypothetical protein
LFVDRSKTRIILGNIFKRHQLPTFGMSRRKDGKNQ